MSIIERIFYIMEEKKIRASDLQKELNVTYSQISNWHKRNTDPPAKYILQICNILEVSPEYLLSSEELIIKPKIQPEKISTSLSKDEIDLYQCIGKRVHVLLNEQGKRQKDLADFLGTATSTVHGWKQGNRNPSSEVLLPICEFLDISLEYLLTGKERNTVKQIGNNNDLSIDETDLLSYFRELSRSNQRSILVQMENMIKQENEQSATKQGKSLA
ncbi:MAG: helix-turn-helix transcriptional regulator [Paenibacillaceae bacterium]|nr:helix-turn-helix transcriptional regulator [Paenibacillaceae bacterium]